MLYVLRVLDGPGRWVGRDRGTKGTLADAEVFEERDMALLVALSLRRPCTVVEL